MDCDFTEELRVIIAGGWKVMILVVIAVIAWRDSWPWKRRG